VSSKIRLAEFALVYLAGHLCCLAGFELCRLWDFFHSDFRTVTTFLLASAFFLSMYLLAERRYSQRLFSLLFVVWVSAVAFPLLFLPSMRAAGFGFLGAGLVLFTQEGPKRRIGVLIVCLAACCHYLGLLSMGWGALLGLVAAGAEYSRTGVQAPPEANVSRTTLQPRAEIFWRGFAQLYSSCERGEGEKFSRQVLKDTLEVVRRAGGVLESGSEHRGVYIFSDEEGRRVCRRNLSEYQQGLDRVLESVGAPKVKLVFNQIDT
jgi:hypothetical protein